MLNSHAIVPTASKQSMVGGKSKLVYKKSNEQSMGPYEKYFYSYV